MTRLRRYAAAVMAFSTALASEAWAAPAATMPTDTVRKVIAASQRIPPGGIHDLEAVDIGGTKQWISVRGTDPKNPLLLFIHGGPGSTMMPESWTWQRPWEDFFTVVQWDQRGAGKSFSSAGRKPDPAMTTARMQADGEEVIQFLLRRYGKKKLFVMGHSWGSVLGLGIAQSRPDLLYAYIGVGQVVNGRENEIVGYRQTLAKAEALGNRQAIRDLKAIAPYPGDKGAPPLEKVIAERKWDVALGGMLYGQAKDGADQIRALSPDYTDFDVVSAGLGEIASSKILLPQIVEVNFDEVTDFRCPIFIFAGAEDRTTPETLAEDYFSRVHAPQKKFYKIARAAHYVVAEAPGEVLLDVVRDIRPLAQ